MRVAATLLGAWVAWRWLGFFVGLFRLRRFDRSVRGEARRTVIARGAVNVFFSVAVVYMWAVALRLQPDESFVGFLAAMLMCSLAVGVAAAFMQPAERAPETLDVCRVRRRRPAAPQT